MSLRGSSSDGRTPPPGGQPSGVERDEDRAPMARIDLAGEDHRLMNVFKDKETSHHGGPFI
eukprot:218399-Amphidinium_carterae.1